MYRLAQTFRALQDPSRESDQELSRQIEFVAKWSSQAAEPAILFVLDARARGKISAADATGALRLIEGFLVRRMIAGIPTNALGRILNAVPRALAASMNILHDLHVYLLDPRRAWPGDAQLIDAVQSQTFYVNSKMSPDIRREDVAAV